METNYTIIELDFDPKRDGLGILKSIALQLVLVISFVLFGSYQNPTIRVNNQLVLRNSNQINALLKSEIYAIAETSLSDTILDINNQINKLLIDFYKKRNFEPAWINRYSLNNQFRRYINLLDSAKYYGFPVDYFNAGIIKSLNKNLSENNSVNIISDLVNIELTTTFSALKYMLFLNHGIVFTADTTQLFKESISALPERLIIALQKNDFVKEFASLQPESVEHQKLLNSLPNFIDLILSFRYTTPAFIDDNLLAKSLFYVNITESPKFDLNNTKADALFKLEEMYGLALDTILNRPTHEIIVNLIQQKYYLACLNINRLRHLNSLGENYLFVNIPEFKLHVIESKELKEEFNVVVGKKETPTPTLSSSIEKVVANPYWTVPKSIVDNEMIHKIRKDSTYLKKHGYYIINGREETVDESVINWSDPDPLGNRYWIRQTNSSSNALGQVKFIFPNEFSVYLHDTPSKALFSNKYRAYSHGCVRLENPDKLAQYLTSKYYSENIDFKKLISLNEHQVIDMQEKINIHIQYITCGVGEDNEIEFFNDIYGLDEKEINETFQGQFQI